MIYNYTSVKRVISKVFSDLNLQEESHRISDFVEWIGEGLDQIGAFPSLMSKVSGKDGEPLLELSNYITKLPHDVHTVQQVAYSSNKSGPFYPMRYGTGSFDYYSELNSDISNDSDSSDVVALTDLVTLSMSIYDEDYEDALERINTDSSVRGTLTGLLKNSDSYKTLQGGTVYTNDYTYIVQNGYIKTNVKTGYIMLSYQAIPVDSEGYPLIPDLQSFLEALYWYVVVKYYYPMWAQGRIRDRVYYEAKRSWNYYSKQAYAEAMMPNPDKMKSIANSWNRLVPVIEEHSNFNSTLGQQQLIYNNNNN